MLLPSKFLAMEWRNNPKDIDHVEITLKDHMVCLCVSVLLSMTIMTTFSYSYSMTSLSQLSNIRVTKRVLVLVN